MHVYQTKAKITQAHQYVKTNQLMYSKGLQTHFNNHISRHKKNRVRGPKHSIAQLSLKSRAQSRFANNQALLQMVPKNRHEYRTIVDFYRDNHELENNALAKKLIDELEAYSKLSELEESPRLIKAIKQQLNTPDVIDELKLLAIENPKSKAQKSRWAFIKQHLENATSDELNEYKSWSTRWSHRLIKYGAVPEVTLAVQGAMQFGMGNPVSGGAFLARGALFELKQALTHGISLSRKIASPKGWQGVITSVSVLAEGAKFFETWTPAGLMPKPEKLALVNASNYIKKIRAGVMGLKELPKLCFDYDLSPVDKIVNASVGEVENILNFINIGLQVNATKLNKDIIYNIINNIAKLIRHVVDLIRLLITACKKKPTRSEMSVHLLNDNEANAFSYQSQDLKAGRMKAQTLDQKSSINFVQEGSDASSVNSENEHSTMKKTPQAVNRSYSEFSSLRDLPKGTSFQGDKEESIRLEIEKRKQQQAIIEVNQLIDGIGGAHSNALDKVKGVFAAAERLEKQLPSRYKETIQQAKKMWQEARDMQKSDRKNVMAAEGIRVMALQLLYPLTQTLSV